DLLSGSADVVVACVAELAVGTLRGVAADRQRGVDEKLKPVDGLLDARTALCPDRSGVPAAREHPLDRVGDARERRPRRRGPEVIGAIGKEVPPARLRSDIALADVGPIPRSEPFRIAG